VTCYTQPCKPCEVTYILHYLPQGDESSPRGRWGICVPALPGVLTALREFHGRAVPNTHMRSSKQIDFVLTTGGLTNSIETIGLLDCSALNSDHRALFIDLCIEEIFGPSPEKLA
jgi:hypothetical protein